MPRITPALAVAGVFFAQALLLVSLVRWAAPTLVFVAGPLAGMVGAAACLYLARLRLGKPASDEPWTLDAWGSLLGGFALAALGWSVGPEAASMGFLLAALFVALGAMATSSRA